MEEESVRDDNVTSSTLVINTGAPQGCVLSPLFYILFTHDCSASSPSGLIVKYAVDATVLGLITNNETDYRNEVQHLASWCDNNNLVLNTKKSKEIIVDFRRNGPINHRPLFIGSKVVKSVSSFKFLGFSHRISFEEGPTTPRLPEEAEEHPHPQTSDGELLQLCHQ